VIEERVGSAGALRALGVSGAISGPPTFNTVSGNRDRGARRLRRRAPSAGGVGGHLGAPDLQQL